MAGSERSGPLAASAALFDGRPWAVTPHDDVRPGGGRAGRGAGPAVRRRTGAAEPGRARPRGRPDLARARTCSPRWSPAGSPTRPTDHLALSGQGVRDVTRVAAGDPALYGQIVAANAEAVLDLLAEVRDRLDAVIDAVGAARPGRARGGCSRRAWPAPGRSRASTAARSGRRASVFVSVPDHPGELARLFADAGASEVNIEDVHIDHDPGRPVGLVELLVDEERAEHLLASLESRGWVTHR